MKKALAIGLVTGFMTVTVGNGVQAGCCRDNNTGAINGHTTRTGNYIVDTIREVGARIMGSDQGTIHNVILTLQDVIANNNNEISRLIAAQERMFDGAASNAVLRQREEYRAAAEAGRYDPATTACTTLSIVTRAAAGAGSGESGGENGVMPPDALPVEAARNARLCRSEGGEYTDLHPVCQSLGAVSRDIREERDALAGVGGLEDPTADVRLLLAAPTISTRNQEQVERALARLARNITDPFPPAPIGESELNPESTREIAARQIEMARRSAPQSLLGYVVDYSTASIPADNVSEMVPAGYSEEIPDRISRRQLHDILVRSRHSNPEWHLAVAAMSPEAVQRELLLIQALHLELFWERMNLELYRSVNDATATSVAIEN